MIERTAKRGTLSDRSLGLFELSEMFGDSANLVGSFDSTVADRQKVYTTISRRGQVVSGSIAFLPISAAGNRVGSSVFRGAEMP